jgi:hypothetical protein
MSGQLADSSSFRRIEEISCDAYLAVLAGWELTGDGGELCLGGSVVRGPVERDDFFGTWRVEVFLARGRLRRPVQMRLEIAPWYGGATVLELIPCRQVRPSAAYLAAGDRLLDCLTRTRPASVPARQRPSREHQRAAVSTAVPALSRP